MTTRHTVSTPASPAPAPEPAPAPAPTRPLDTRRARVDRARRLVGAFFVVCGGVHLGIVAADPQLYRGFADGALSSFVRDGWAEVFMAHPALWGLAVAVGETTLGVLLLRGGRRARIGWLGLIAFHVALMLFGWGFWLWSLPALALLVPLAVADRRLGAHRSSTTGRGA